MAITEMSDPVFQRISDLQQEHKKHIILHKKVAFNINEITKEEKDMIYNLIYFYITNVRREAWELFVYHHTGLSNKMLGKEHNYLYSLFAMDFEKDIHDPPLPVKEEDMVYLRKRLQEIKLTPPPLDS